MTDHQPDSLQRLQMTLDAHIQKTEANRQSSLIVELAVLSFLVDAGIATIEQVHERIGVFYTAMPDSLQVEPVSLRLGHLTACLTQLRKSGPRKWTPVIIEGGLDLSSKDDCPNPPG